MKVLGLVEDCCMGKEKVAKDLRVDGFYNS
jgi:hypothetical protein